MIGSVRRNNKMGSYIPSTKQEQKEILTEIGLQSYHDLYPEIPENIKLTDLAIPKGKSEMEIVRFFDKIAGKNRVFSSIFRGAGAYHHFIPSIVESIVQKEEFVTAYTPYQAEISQGILQYLFEYQTMICELTGMEAADASLYDGASAAAEAVSMSRTRQKNRVLISAAANPMVIRTIKTYGFGSNADITLIPEKDGKTDGDALKQLIDDRTACVYIQQPNYYGLLESATEIGELTHRSGAKYIIGVNPIAMGIVKTPGECQADIAVGEGQPLGLPMGFGGPYLGFMATTQKLMRKMPGHIIGETVDNEHNRAYVLTMQAREQHIRREHATSNICTNQALCALAASAYLTVMGPRGLQDVATQCLSKAHYLAEQLCTLKGFTMNYHGPFFHEFVTTTPIDAHSLLQKLAAKDILGGYPVNGGILWCATEMNTKAEIDRLIAILQEMISK
jgi:glycine dehydrogenase subunit 1